jgi:hypothetical protein
MKKFESFFWGLISACGAVVLQFVFFIVFSNFIDPTMKISFEQFFAMPLFIVLFSFIEEFFKYLMISKRICEISSRKNFLINTFMLGLGFFSFELVLVLTSSSGIEINQLVEIAILHISAAVFMGYFIFTAKSPGRSNLLAWPLLFATAFHSSFNFLVLQTNPLSGYALILGLVFLVLLDFRLFSNLDRALAQDPK